MRLVILAAAFATSMTLAAPAFAQAKDSTDSFTGPHVEAVAGWDYITDGSGVDRTSSGIAYGGAAGWDFQAGRFVVGIEGEVTGSSSSEQRSNLLTAGDTFRVSAGRDLYVGGRLGAAIAPRLLIYAKGGYTNGGFDTRYFRGATITETHQDLDGWRVGGGLEYKLTHNIYAKAEYRYSHYDGLSGGIHLARQQVLGGLGVRF